MKNLVFIISMLLSLKAYAFKIPDYKAFDLSDKVSKKSTLTMKEKEDLHYLFTLEPGMYMVMKESFGELGRPSRLPASVDDSKPQWKVEPIKY